MRPNLGSCRILVVLVISPPCNNVADVRYELSSFDLYFVDEDLQKQRSSSNFNQKGEGGNSRERASLKVLN